MKPQMKTVPWIIFACFLTAVFEGLDIQSMGVAAPGLAPEFGLRPGELGLAMSASTIGLMIGAAAGGWMSDRRGRRFVIIVSMALLGIFSLATAWAPNFPALLVIRVLAGLGLGGAFPNLIALVSETAAPRSRVTALSLMYCGLPLGGAAAGGLMSLADAADWRLIFYVGGVGPLLLIPILALILPSAAVHRQKVTAAATGGAGGLFGARVRTTLLLWTSYFFTLFVVYLLLNWLPSLLVSKGFSKPEASALTMVMNLGAVVGSLVLGRLADLNRPRFVLILAYGGMLSALLLLIFGGQGFLLKAGIVAAGFFVIGGQLILYALGPAVYPIAIRGTGVGAAVAVGRAGSVVGPIFAGLVVSMGVAPTIAPVIALPGLAVALVAGLLLAGRTRAAP